MSTRPTILAGIPTQSAIIYRKIRFAAPDTVVLIELPGAGSHLILREIEVGRAKEAGAAEKYYSPKDLVAPDTISGDRETANAQAAAALLKGQGVGEVWTDRSLPMIFAHYLAKAGVTVRCDPEMGVLERRSKDEREVEHLRKAQRITEQAVEMACQMIAKAQAGAGGVLKSVGEELTSESVRAQINIFLLHHGMGTSDSIVAGGAQGADCHHRGAGPLRTGEPVVVDIFPRDPKTLYCGDCTRTVVHGEAPPAVVKMHDAVLVAKRAAIDAARAGATGEAVHAAACAVFTARGYSIGLPPEGALAGFIGYAHGTGHGIGLDVHEPPLLDKGGPALVSGDALTIEPGLYGHSVGGVRVEDMVIVREGACENLNTIHEGLDWS